MAQRGDPTRFTRFRGPTKVTLRGAGSSGNEPYTKGQFTDAAFGVQIPSGQAADGYQLEKPEGTVVWAVDQNGNIRTMGGVLLTYQQAQVNLTAANILAMNGTPVSILAAPGAGLAIVVSEILFEMKTTSTQFASGGAVSFVYHGGSTAVHAGTIPATVVNATAGTSVTGLWAASGTNGLTIPSNTGVDITNATGAFTTGTGTAIVYISYGILTLG